MSKKSIIFILASQFSVYNQTLVKKATSFFPLLNFATIAALPKTKGHQVTLIDGNIEPLTEEFLFAKLKIMRPDFVGLSLTTALVNENLRIARIINNFDSNICILVGGPHFSSLPEETLQNHEEIDLGIIGEGDFSFSELVEGISYDQIKGLVYRQNGKVIVNPSNEIRNLDDLPFPEWSIYDLAKYSQREIRNKNVPIGWIETSRGCVHRCSYCNKSIFGTRFRKKSAERVVEEFKYYQKTGFNQINIADDNFTTDIKRVNKICDLLIEDKFNIPWSPVTGIRVDNVNLITFQKMKQAGCYSVCFGIESGDQTILDKIPKHITLEQIREAVNLANQAGLETVGYFMLALPGETKESMQKTINFARSLNLDLAKASITIPLPNTKLFNDLKSENRIKSYDWSKYNFYVPASEVYIHQNLDWKTVDTYFSKFYRSFYFRPKFILKRLLNSIREKTLFYDIKLLFQTKW